MWLWNQMFLNWFGQHSSQKDRLPSRWSWLMQLNQGGISGSRKYWAECVNVSHTWSCSLPESFTQWSIIGGCWALACEHSLMNRSISGPMYLLARYINFIVGQQIVQEYYCAWLCHSTVSQSVGKTMNKIKSLWKQLSMAPYVQWTIHQNRHQWSVNGVSTEQQWFLPFLVWQLNSDFVAVAHDWPIYSTSRQMRQQYGNCPILRISVNGASWMFSYVCWVM